MDYSEMAEQMRQQERTRELLLPPDQVYTAGEMATAKWEEQEGKE